MSNKQRIRLPLADLLAEPRRDAMRLTQALMGEAIEKLSSHEGWARVRLVQDGYEGFVDEDALGFAPSPDTQIKVPASHAYSRPDIKSEMCFPLYLGAQIKLVTKEGDFYRTAQDVFIKACHIEIESPSDAATMALRFLNVPYLWGGKTFAGLDCSGLIQISLQACGYACPRDSTPQSQNLGEPVAEGQALKRNDLIFWPGHVGILTKPDRLLHANAFHMMVVEEDLAAAIARIGKPSIIRRL